MLINDEKQNFVTISKYAGERYDLTQAGGGNSSVKLEGGEMLIKSSGHLLSEVNENSGYVSVDLQKVLGILEDPILIETMDKRERENRAAYLMKETVISSVTVGENRPSIETFLHAVLGKFTLHTHPIAVNILTCQKDWVRKLEELFPDALFVEYQTPGIELALELKKEFEAYLLKYGYMPSIVFLQNHGLIVTSDNPREIPIITNDVVEKVENMLNLDFKRFRLTNKLSNMLHRAGNNQVISYISEDLYLTQSLPRIRTLLTKGPLNPDTMVFCGYHPIEINNNKDAYKIEEYYYNHQAYPKVIIYEGHLFFVATNVKKAKEIEEVFKSHVITLDLIVDNENSLDIEELRYLDNWEAEKYRQKV